MNYTIVNPTIALNETMNGVVIMGEDRTGDFTCIHYRKPLAKHQAKVLVNKIKRARYLKHGDTVYVDVNDEHWNWYGPKDEVLSLYMVNR